jgi:hypothetical protein
MVLFPDDPVLPRSYINTGPAPGVRNAPKSLITSPTPGTIHEAGPHGSRPFATVPYYYGVPLRASITMPMAY